jgi:hypothetical protein
MQLSLYAQVIICSSSLKLCTVTIHEHIEPYLPKNYIRIAAYVPDLHNLLHN